jgi:hypothetical protein
VWVTPGTAVAAVAASLLAAGCGGEPAATPEQRVRATLRDFGRATAAKDYERLCTRIFSPELVRNLSDIDLPCEKALQEGLASVTDPRLSVGRVTVRGDKASAEVASSAAGQEPSRDTVELVRTKDGWRIAKLSPIAG